MITVLFCFLVYAFSMNMVIIIMDLMKRENDLPGICTWIGKSKEELTRSVLNPLWPFCSWTWLFEIPTSLMACPSHKLKFRQWFLTNQSIWGSQMLVTVDWWQQTSLHPPLQPQEPYSNAGVIVKEVCQAWMNELKEKVMPQPKTKEEWKAIAQQFQEQPNVPHVLGALDGTNVAIKKPPESRSGYYKYKYSAILMPWSMQTTKSYRMMGRTSLLWTAPWWIWLEEAHQQWVHRLHQKWTAAKQQERDALLHIRACGFPLRTYLMKPHWRRCLSNEIMTTSYHMSKGRQVV